MELKKRIEMNKTPSSIFIQYLTYFCFVFTTTNAFRYKHFILDCEKTLHQNLKARIEYLHKIKIKIYKIFKPDKISTNY